MFSGVQLCNESLYALIQYDVLILQHLSYTHYHNLFLFSFHYQAHAVYKNEAEATAIPPPFDCSWSQTYKMAARSSSPAYPADKDRKLARSANGPDKSVKGKPTDYTSHGVTDNDIFLLPGSDFQLLGLLTAIAALVRLFRIYQPSSVVFDEVQ